MSAVVCYRFSRRGFLDGEPPPAGGLARVRGRRFVSTRLPRFARNDNVIRVYAWFYNVNPYKSPLTPLKFVIPRERSDRGNLAEAERKQRRPNYYNYSWTVVIVSLAGDFSTASRRRQVGWRVHVTYRFFRWGFLDYARNDIGVRFAAKPSVGRDALVPPPVCLRCHSDRSKDGCPYIAEKSPTVEELSPCALRPSSLPGDCRVATAPRNDSGDTGARSVLSTVAYSAIPIILSFLRTKRRRGSRRANRA